MLLGLTGYGTGMGVVETMLQSGSLQTIPSIADSHSEERLGRVLFENCDCSFRTGLPKYKKHKISAARDFPPGCGRLLAQEGNVEEISVENSICKDDKNGGLKDETFNFPKDANQVEVASLENVISAVLSDTTIFPPFDANGHKSVSNSSGLVNSTARKHPPRRSVSAVRDFPPFCGRNAPPIPKEESQKVLRSVTLNSFDTKIPEGILNDLPSLEISMTDMKEKVEYFQDGDFQKDVLEGNGSKVVKDEFHSECEIEPLKQPPLKKDGSIQKDSGSVIDDESSAEAVKTDMKQKSVGDGDPQNDTGNQFSVNENKDKLAKLSGTKMGQGDAREDGIEPPFENKLCWWDNEFETIIFEKDGVAGSSVEKMGKEVGIHSNEKNMNEELLDTSGISNQLQIERYGSPKLTSDWVVVQGLMAASSCPWRQGKGPLKSKMSVDASEGKKIDPKGQLERSKTVVKKKVDKKEFGVKSIKKTPPAKVKTIDRGTGKLAIQGRKDLEHTEKHGSLSLLPKTSGLDVYVPPIGNGSSSSKNHDKDASITRNKVREILRLFQAICRKLLQEEEAGSSRGEKGIRRIDYEAARILKAKEKYVNTGKQILGSIPGVEVGDEFHYRVELNIIGLHRPIQGGMDYVKQDKEILATSIVASGGHADELDSSDVLIYTGQGENVMHTDKEPEDQKLERGNLALKNSMNEKNPIRVIRGSESSDGKSRTYVYDGLYLMKKCWQDLGSHGKLVFKFQLERIPGQPELAWREVKKSKKAKVREGLCVEDISQGKELIPIRAINTTDDEKPPPLKYITRVMYPKLLVLTPPKGCDCVAKCSDSEKCSCAVKNGGEIPFNHNGAIVEAKPLVYECGPSCKCPSSCPNRVSQHGIKFQLEIFKTESRGWGMRSLDSITSGSFICEYIGELLEEKEADARTGNDEYLFDIGDNYNDSSLWNGLPTLMSEEKSSSYGIVEDGDFTIDAAEYGNVGRFINHSCTPNLYAQNVLYDHDDKRIPHIMFFAAENIPPLQELTYHYNYMMDQVRDANGNIKKKSCFCGSAECTGRMY